MPSLITTIEDSSPVISYSGDGGSDWTAGTSNDSSIDLYSDSSYMFTQIANASFSFTFYGTGVQVYGAERADHGLYQVIIDIFQYPQTSGQLNGTERFQTLLFQTTGLKNEMHVLRVVNLGNTTFDLDFITWETSIGQDQESLLSSTFQDSDPSFVYTPASAWNVNPGSIGSAAIGTFNGGSAHVTSTAGAYVEYTFTGAAVELYGPVGPQGAPYTVQLDNGSTTNYTSFKQFNRPQTLLFQAGDLGSGAHTVRLTSEAGNSSLFLGLGIDYALVFSTPSLKPTPAFAAGSILAIIFGILLAFSLIATGYLFFSHRRGMSAKGSETTIPFSQVKYHPVGAPSRRPKPGSFASMQSEYRAVDTNPEVSDANVQVISVPPFLDGKYRPDISPLPWQETANISPLSNSSPPHTFLHSDMVEQEGSRREIGKGGNSVIQLLPPVASSSLFTPVR